MHIRQNKRCGGLLTAWTAFTGGGLADIGLQNAGLKLVGGLELDLRIAAVANMNLGANHVNVADITQANPTDFPYAHWAHFSPPCTRASQGNVKGSESELDLKMADAIINFIIHHKYQVVSIENVIPYQHFQSFKNIVSALTILGYGVKWWRLNAADYGVPQTRKRLFLVARLDNEPQKPKQTHMKYELPPLGTLFNLNDANQLPRWRSWYEAVEDLIPSLPVGKLASWQVARLNSVSLPNICLIDSNNSNNKGKLTIRKRYEPSNTIGAGRTPIARLCINGVILETDKEYAARIQTIPNNYKLPSGKSLPIRIIGNAVPCLLMEKIARANIDK